LKRYFRKVLGVVNVAVGYSDGHTENPVRRLAVANRISL